MNNKLLHLLQLASPTLPLGAYSYSEGLETLVEQLKIKNPTNLFAWLEQELIYGAIRIESALMLKGYQGLIDNQLDIIIFYNRWLTASKETKELRQQSWQMGNSLVKLILNLLEEDRWILPEVKKILGQECNYAIAFGIAAALWEIDRESALLAYLQSWATNLISAGIKLIPLGQTTGQQILYKLNNIILRESQSILSLSDDQLYCCSFGLGLASMNHENLYTRLFRS
jgi:urease accessory protein